MGNTQNFVNPLPLQLEKQFNKQPKDEEEVSNWPFMLKEIYKRLTSYNFPDELIEICESFCISFPYSVKPGDEVDVRWLFKGDLKWKRAIIINIKPNDSIYVHFQGIEKPQWEWIKIDSKNIKHAGTKVKTWVNQKHDILNKQILLDFPNLKAKEFNIGDEFICKTTENICHSVVVDKKLIADKTPAIFLHYLGFNHEYDEWIDLNPFPDRLIPLKQHSPTVKKDAIDFYNFKQNLKIGQEIDAFDIPKGCKTYKKIWRRAIVVLINSPERLVYVHYQGWNFGSDEWISLDRVVPLYQYSNPINHKFHNKAYDINLQHIETSLRLGTTLDVGDEVDFQDKGYYKKAIILGKTNGSFVVYIQGVGIANQIIDYPWLQFAEFNTKTKNQIFWTREDVLKMYKK